MQAWQAALSTWLAFLAAVLALAVQADLATSAILAEGPLPAVNTDTATCAILADVLLPAVNTDTATCAFLASAPSPYPGVHTNLATIAFSARVFPLIVRANAGTAIGSLFFSTVQSCCLPHHSSVSPPLRS